ncbi:hypothetical protein Goari_002978 [Gossypium aridum]|uniref:Uncharacterized protein n=1 Tax=Gossypium aridum TaxID=34290 RepID=A0A7J8YA14_GOSAI|nr:hypothetical protein [Gossypium aridum]
MFTFIYFQGKMVTLRGMMKFMMK